MSTKEVNYAELFDFSTPRVIGFEGSREVLYKQAFNHASEVAMGAKMTHLMVYSKSNTLLYYHTKEHGFLADKATIAFNSVKHFEERISKWVDKFGLHLLVLDMGLFDLHVAGDYVSSFFKLSKLHGLSVVFYADSDRTDPRYFAESDIFVTDMKDGQRVEPYVKKNHPRGARLNDLAAKYFDPNISLSKIIYGDGRD